MTARSRHSEDAVIIREMVEILASRSEHDDRLLASHPDVTCVDDLASNANDHLNTLWPWPDGADFDHVAEAARKYAVAEMAAWDAAQ